MEDDATTHTLHHLNTQTYMSNGVHVGQIQLCILPLGTHSNIYRWIDIDIYESPCHKTLMVFLFPSLMCLYVYALHIYALCNFR